MSLPDRGSDPLYPAFALILHRAGDAAAARDQFAALLPVTERVLGAEHPDTLDVRASLARWTSRADDDSRNRRSAGGQLDS
jgi:hypothetical protein